MQANKKPVKESANKKAKKDLAKIIESKIKDAKSVVIAEYRGLTVAELLQLRREAKKQGIEIKVFKNRIFKIAAKAAGYKDFENNLVGPNLFAFSNQNDIVAAKVLVKFAKDNKLLVPKIAIYEGKIVDAKAIQEIATLPTYEEALTILARSLMAPLQQLSLSLKLFSEKNENK